MKTPAYSNLPPINSPRRTPEKSRDVWITYSPHRQVLALHHSTAKEHGPILIELRKLETASQFLGVIALVYERAPELVDRLMTALDRVLLDHFRIHLYEMGRHRNGPKLDWRRGVAYAR